MEDLGAWFKNHNLKMLSYNALVFFNMKQTQAEKDAVMSELDEIIRRCNILNCKMIVVVPSMDLPVHATVEVFLLFFRRKRFGPVSEEILPRSVGQNIHIFISKINVCRIVALRPSEVCSFHKPDRAAIVHRRA